MKQLCNPQLILFVASFPGLGRNEANLVAAAIDHMEVLDYNNIM